MELADILLDYNPRDSPTLVQAAQRVDMGDALVTLRHFCNNLTTQRGVLVGEPWECRYSTLESMRHMDQAYQCPEHPCPMEYLRTVLFWSLKVRSKKMDR